MFAAVLRTMVDGFIGQADAAAPTMPKTLPEALAAFAAMLLDAALRPDALALHRLIVTAGDRVPDLPDLLARGGLREGIRRLAALLRAHRPGLPDADAAFLAEQFQSMVLTGPQRRALGLGIPLDATERAQWCDRTVRLFLAGLDGATAPAPASSA